MSNSNNSLIEPKNTPVPLDKCGMALAAQHLMEKWNMLIIREAFYGVARFEDILEDLQIPRSVLTTRLKQLVALGILDRTPYQPEGSRTRNGYVLTKKGWDLGLTILALMQWGDTHLNGGESQISVVDKRNGDPLRVGLVPMDQNGPSLTDLEIVFKHPNKKGVPNGTP